MPASDLTPRTISLNFSLDTKESEMRKALEDDLRAFGLEPMPDTFALEVIEEGRQAPVDAFPTITHRWVKAEMDGVA